MPHCFFVGWGGGGVVKLAHKHLSPLSSLPGQSLGAAGEGRDRWDLDLAVDLAPGPAQHWALARPAARALGGAVMRKVFAIYPLWPVPVTAWYLILPTRAVPGAALGSPAPSRRLLNVLAG